MNLISVAVSPALAEVEGTVRAQAEAKGLTLTVTSPTCEMFVTADPERFQQILLNLITNAITFTATGESICVACDGDASTVRVRDR